MTDFATQVLGHYPALLRYCMRFSTPGLPFDPEDLAQQTVLRALEKQATYTPGNMGGWLTRIAHNLACDQIDRDKKWAKGWRDVDFDVIAEEAPDERWPNMGDFLADCIKELRPIHNAVLLLVDVKGATYAEAAVALNIPEGTVMSRLFRARRCLEIIVLERTNGP
jgi:RNA polymerase sigma-70 factor (ECF subfamily)